MVEFAAVGNTVALQAHLHGATMQVVVLVMAIHVNYPGHPTGLIQCLVRPTLYYPQLTVQERLWDNRWLAQAGDIAHGQYNLVEFSATDLQRTPAIPNDVADTMTVLDDVAMEAEATANQDTRAAQPPNNAVPTLAFYLPMSLLTHCAPPVVDCNVYLVDRPQRKRPTFNWHQIQQYRNNTANNGRSVEKEVKSTSESSIMGDVENDGSTALSSIQRCPLLACVGCWLW